MPRLLAGFPRDLAGEQITLSIRRSTAIAVALSLLVHLLLAVFWVLKPPVTTGVAASQGPLVARLRPRPAAPAPTTAQPEPAPPQAAPERPPERPRVPREPNRARLITRPGRPPGAPPPLPPLPPPAPTVVDNNPQTDMMADLTARRARAAQAAQETGSERELSADEKAAANIRNNLARKPVGTNGIFTIQDKGIRTASLVFRGWTTDERNARPQYFQVDAGLGGNVEVAIIRKVIEVIRQHYKTEFNWISARSGKVIVLSARPEDSAALESYLRNDLFGAPR